MVGKAEAEIRLLTIQAYVCIIMVKEDLATMAKRKRYALFLNADQLEIMQAIQKKAGIPVSEQIRRAIDFYLEHYTVSVQRKGGRK
jgi:hypothetical protein